MRLALVDFHLFRGSGGVGGVGGGGGAHCLSNLASYQIGKRHSCEVFPRGRLGPASKPTEEYVLRQSNPIRG